MKSKENTLVEVSRLATYEGDPIPELGKELISLQGPLPSVDGVKSLSFLSVQEQYAEIVEEAYHREKESKPRTKHFTEEPSEVKAHILEVSPNMPLGPQMRFVYAVTAGSSEIFLPAA